MNLWLNDRPKLCTMCWMACLFLVSSRIAGCERAASRESGAARANDSNRELPVPADQPSSPATSQPASSSSAPADQDPYWLADEAMRTRFLASRIRTGQMLGSFNGMVSMWYGIMDVLVSCKTKEVAETPLRSPFPDFYKPTWREYFDAVALQTHTHWRYQDDTYGFMFEQPALPLPFEIQLADGWRAERRGSYVAFIPAQANVGMDIYMGGSYSAEKDEAALHERVRADWAMAFLPRINAQATIEDMQTVEVDGAEALFISTAHPKTKVLWRQWVFVKDGMCFLIVSAIQPEQDETLWPDVQAMRRSFRAVGPSDP